MTLTRPRSFFDCTSCSSCCAFFPTRIDPKAIIINMSNPLVAAIVDDQLMCSKLNSCFALGSNPHPLPHFLQGVTCPWAPFTLHSVRQMGVRLFEGTCSLTSFGTCHTSSSKGTHSPLKMNRTETKHNLPTTVKGYNHSCKLGNWGR